MIKVQAAVVGVLLIIAGCGKSTEERGEVQNNARFGSGYEIVTNEEPALPDEPPALMNDTLFAHVAYSGGCADHDFDLESEVRGDTARVWLRHDANGDDCEGMIRDRLDVRVPEEVLTAETILLLNPNADVPFVLRWGEGVGPSDTGLGPSDTTREDGI